MSQLGFGPADAVGVPFNYLGNAGIVTGSTYTMQAASLVLQPTATVAAFTVNLPLNPADGCVAEISNVGTATITALTVAANTGDAIVGGLGVPTIFTFPAASTTAPSAVSTYRYKYSLNGFAPGVGQTPVNPRTWFRVA